MKKYLAHILIIIILFGVFSLLPYNKTKAQLIDQPSSDVPQTSGGILDIQNSIPPTTTTTPATNSPSSSSTSFTSTTDYKGLVPCDNSTANKCDFNQLMNLINTLIHFALFDLALPIVAIMFVYAGFELVTSGGSTEKRGIAKKVFTSAVIGFVIALAGWLIVKTILTILGYSGAWIGF